MMGQVEGQGLSQDHQQKIQILHLDTGGNFINLKLTLAQ